MPSVVIFGRNEKNWFQRPGWDCENGEYLVVEPYRDGFRLQAALRNSKNGFKLEYKYIHGYLTEQEAADEADLFRYAVQKTLRKIGLPLISGEAAQIGGCADLTNHPQYFDEFVESNMFRLTPTFKRPVSSVSPPLTIPLNAAQTSQFEKLKQSSCATLSQNKYLEATASSNDFYDRCFERKLTCFENSGL